jgi:hypothetical protein
VHLFLLKQVYKPNSVRLRASIIYLVAASRRQSICLPSNPDSCKPIERATLPATKAKAGIHGISTHKVYSRYILLCSPWALTPHFHPYRCCQRRLFSVTLSILLAQSPVVIWCVALRCSDFPAPTCQLEAIEQLVLYLHKSNIRATARATIRECEFGIFGLLPIYFLLFLLPHKPFDRLLVPFRLRASSPKA